MNPQKTQPKYLELTPEELAKVTRTKDRQTKVKVSPEELFIAEFGTYFGWEAVVAITKDKISMDDASMLLTGARKIWSAKMVDLASIMFTASAASQSGKKAKEIMNKGLKDFIKEAKADI